MNKKDLSFTAAVLATLGLFVLLSAFVVEKRDALASSTSFDGRAIVEDGRYSVPQKRRIRQQVLNSQDELLNLTGAEVRAILDQPELIRRDAPTIVWQYRNDECVVDLYFTTGAAKALKAPVVHFETRPRHDEVSDERVEAGCVEALVRENAPARFVSFDSIYKSQ